MNDNNKDWAQFRDEIENDEDLIDEPSSKEEEASQDEQSESEEQGSLEHPSYADLEEQLTIAEQKAHENWEKCVRVQAELENIRRRAERDVANAHRYGLEKFASELLSVLDSLEQALQIAQQNADSDMLEGLELTMKLFMDVMQKHGVEQINPEGEVFNPQYHEAMSMQDAEGVEPNTVLTVFQKGYKLNDRVIRPARVIVAKKA